MILRTSYSTIGPAKVEVGGNDVRAKHPTNHGTPIALGVTCVTREVLTLVALVLNEIGSRIGLDFANWLEERD
jgi:hypothetical protein